MVVSRRTAAWGVVAAALLLVALWFPQVASGGLPKFLTVTEHGTAPTAELAQVIASCPAGYHATGGGYEIESINPDLYVEQSDVLTPDNYTAWAWAVTLVNPTPVNADFSVTVICERG